MTYRNFTILGNPTITDNGDASNISSSDQISAALNPSGNELILTGEYTWGGVAPSGASGLFFLGDSSNFVQLYQVQSGQLELFTRVSGTSYYDFGRFTITANVPLKYILTLGVNSLNLTGYQNGVEVVNNTISTHIPAVSTLTNIKLSSFGVATQGIINIRQMLITDNNGYVYQPYSSDFKPINRIYNRHDTASNFSTNNPVLGNGEVAVETDTSKIKVGDGSTAYNALPYVGGSGDLTNYYTKNETSALLSTKQDLLHEQAPLEISVNAIDNVSTSSNLSYDVTTGVITKSFTSYAEVGYIDFLIPSDVNIDILSDYWRLGSLDNIKADAYLLGPSQPDKPIMEIYDEDGNTISRVRYEGAHICCGSNSTIGTWTPWQSSTGSPTLMQHIADATTTTDGVSSSNFSDGYTLSHKRLAKFRLYYTSKHNDASGWGSEIFTSQSGSNYVLSSIRIFTSADDTTGIVISGTTTTKYLKLNIGTGLAVQNGDLVNTVDISNKVTGSGITDIVALTQAQYDALTTKDANTFYVIIPASNS